ncbi:MAG TPA: TIGR03617 family F420-dependent LLM class oxidoreductase [Candidatus Binatia bacterium]|nr:TIGR03617 family F420-dependent LLM class oxidoreductase [Candidatus Binatia bacterium]
MKVDTAFFPSTFAAAAQTARRAEESGFDGLWSAETSHDPFFPLVVAARETQRINLGTGVAIVFPRSPMVLANICWDLQANSHGRFILGLGTQVKGHNERRFSVKWAAPVRRLREVILSLRAIWDCWQNDTKLNYVGEFYQFTLMTPFFNPGPIEHPKIPIFISGLNPLITQLAGELCEGFYIHGFHSAKYIRETVLPNLDKGLAKGGRKREDFTLITGTFIASGATRDEVEKAKGPVRQQVSFYASTRTYKGVLDAHGWGETCFKLSAKAAKGDWAGMPAEITDEMLEELAVIGTYDEIAEKLAARYKGVLDRVVVGIGAPERQDAGRVREFVQELKRRMAA